MVVGALHMVAYDILSASIFLAVYVNTSSGWLSVLGFLIPSLFMVLWSMITDPKKIPAIGWRGHNLEEE